MNSTVLHRRRIERYAQLLDEASGVRRHHLRSPIDNDLASYVAIGTSLATAAPDVSVRDEFRVKCRARLMATAERQGIGIAAVGEPAVGRASVRTARALATAARPLPKQRASIKPGRVRARGAILAGLAAGTLVLSGISAASGGAMPGDTLYGLKRSQESTQLALAGSPVAKGHLYLGFARTRLSEATAIHAHAHLLSGVLDSMDSETQLGVQLLLADAVSRHDEAAVRSVENFVDNQRRQIDILLNRVNGSTRRRTADSVALLDHVKLRAYEVHTALNCPSIVIVGHDLLGPQPAAACQESSRVTTNTPIQPSTGRHGTPRVTGTDASPADKGTTARSTATSAMSVDPTAPATASPTTDGGLLGDIGRILGGLLGH